MGESPHCRRLRPAVGKTIKNNLNIQSARRRLRYNINHMKALHCYHNPYCFDMKKTGCIIAIIIVALIPLVFYGMIRLPRLIAKGQSYECPYTYGPLEGAWLNLPNDSIAKIRIYSTEVVGGYADKMKGHYKFINDSVLIVHWNQPNKHNVYYKTPYIDTLTIRGENFFTNRPTKWPF